MNRLRAASIIDSRIGFHYAYIRSMKLSSEVHCHDFYEFFITFEDNVLHVVNGKQQWLSGGMLVFIRPDDQHYYEKSSAGNCEIMNVAFPRDIFEELSAYTNAHPFLSQMVKSDMPPAVKLHRLEQKTMKARMQKLALSSVTDKAFIRLEFKALLLELFLHYFYASVPGPDSGQAPAWLSELQDKLQQKEHFKEGLPMLLKLSGKSQAYVNRSIKKHFGLTPTAWLNGFKLQYAANLLQYTDEEIVDIALEAGFENLSHFYHMFKKSFQISPAKFRIAHRKVTIPE